MNQAQHRLLFISLATTLKAMPFMTAADAWRFFWPKQIRHWRQPRKMTKSQARKINWPANSMEWNVKKNRKIRKKTFASSLLIFLRCANCVRFHRKVIARWARSLWWRRFSILRNLRDSRAAAISACARAFWHMHNSPAAPARKQIFFPLNKQKSERFVIFTCSLFYPARN